MMHFKLIISLILAGLALLFAIQNVATVEISFMIWSTSMPRAILVFIVLATGIVIGWLMQSYLLLHRKIPNNELE